MCNQLAAAAAATTAEIPARSSGRRPGTLDDGALSRSAGRSAGQGFLHTGQGSGDRVLQGSGSGSGGDSVTGEW